jgi:Fe-S-cluster containining protein
VSEGEQLATLTLSDLDRISAHTGKRPARYSEEEWLTPQEASEYEARRPLYAGYFRRGSARLTLSRRDGACVFLDRARGCVLPAHVRPSACRLYPFELWPDGSWSFQVTRFGDLVEAALQRGAACLAVELAQSNEDVLSAFALSKEEVEALGTKLREEVQAHARGQSRWAGD